MLWRSVVAPYQEYMAIRNRRRLDRRRQAAASSPRASKVQRALLPDSPNPGALPCGRDALSGRGHGANNPQVRSRSNSANRQSLIVILAFSASGFGARFALPGATAGFSDNSR